MNRFIVLFILLIAYQAKTQSFAPAAGQPGSTAIHKDSSIIVGWGDKVTISRGYQDISFPGSGFATYGEDQDALGVADGLTVVSLGDGGIALYELSLGIENGSGPDFAIFENGFTDDYMELAFVEVSSDGTNFVRFPNVSETPVDVQLDNFSFSDCRYIHNLAGKYRVDYGTPFDLDDLSDSLIDLNNIKWIRIIDVVGSIDSTYATFDSQGNLINDPWPTAFESSGFDLDALAIINQAPLEVSTIEQEFNVYPNPFSDVLELRTDEQGSYKVFSSDGNLLDAGSFSKTITLNTDNYKKGLYFISVHTCENVWSCKLIKI